jgi:malonyl-CoA O-methyltransferase
MLAGSAPRRVTMRGVFVTGTDTGVGKTLVSACLVRRWQADYWKPAQTGLATETGDSDTVALLADLQPHRLHAPRHCFAAPLSVEAAAEAEGATVSLEDFTLPASRRPLIVEGAGGVLAPLCARATMADLMLSLALPCVLVARTTLGTINHTLLSLEALRHRGLTVLGVVLVGDESPGNRDAIARHGRARILAELPRLPAVTSATVAAASGLIPDLEPVAA